MHLSCYSSPLVTSTQPLPLHKTVAFTGRAALDISSATVVTVWAFRQLPSFVFCASSTDPCSCTGGGFEIFATYCNKSFAGANTTTIVSSSKNGTDAAVADVAKVYTERGSIFDSVDSNAVIIFVSIGALVIIVLIFGQARASIASARANDARAMAEAKVLELRETNLKIRKEL